jgi:hypothetical protein
MFTQAQYRKLKIPGSNGEKGQSTSPVRADEDPHAHSPRRIGDENACLSEDNRKRNHSNNPISWSSQSRSHDVAWIKAQQRGYPDTTRDSVPHNGPLADPFLDSNEVRNAPSYRRQKRSTEDTLMPDVPPCEASRSISGMTGVSYEHKDAATGTNHVASHEAIMDQLAEALSPLKSDDDRDLRDPIHNAASLGVFSQDRIVSQQCRPGTPAEMMRIPESPETDVSGNSKVETSRQASQSFVSAIPDGPVQSKKGPRETHEEVQSGDGVVRSELTERSDSSSSMGAAGSKGRIYTSGDSSRKRPLRDISGSNPAEDWSDSSPSPSKKVSKRTSTDAAQQNQSPHTPGAGRDASGRVRSAGVVGGA